VARLHSWASILVSLCAAYAAYLLSDHFGGSGLLAVIASALLAGSAQPLASRHHLHRFWQSLALVLASIVFFLMGLQVRLDQAIGAAGAIAVLFVVMLFARALMVMLVTRLSPSSWPVSWQAAISWVGLRGALSLALALSIPANLPGRTAFLVLVSAFIVLSLGLQGLSMGAVFKWLKIPPQAEPATG
jgi:CPA1 family monovalent cation:H+ antiporter